MVILVINHILEIFQSPSFSVGVLHYGRTIFVKGFGYSDRVARRVPDGNTVYCLGSCTKSFTAVVLGLLVERGKIGWKDPVSNFLPEFQTSHSPIVGQNATLFDLLSHSSGLAPLLLIIVGKHGAILPQHEDVVHICSKLPRISQFRSEWAYDNWPYALTAYLIDRESDGTWAHDLHDVLNLMGMHRTFTRNTDDENAARAYVVFNDGSVGDGDLPQLQDGDAFDGSGSLRSCVNDMFIWYKTIIEASKMPVPIEGEGFEAMSLRTGAPAAQGSPETLKKSSVHTALQTAIRPQIPLAADPSQTYGLGLFSFQLPTYEINTVTNTDAFKTMKSYVMGAESTPRKVIGHTGDLGSYTSAHWTFPETESAVIVMSNASSTYGDPSNLVAQVLTQALFDLQPAVDYLKISSQVVALARSKWQRAVDAWTSRRLQGTQPKDLACYTGVYTSTDLRMTLSVSIISTDNDDSVRGKSLQLCISGRQGQTFDLYHYHLDT